ncbi:MAG: DNA-directed RNA polymerase subunit omega [Acidobacteriota bacterium]
MAAITNKPENKFQLITVSALRCKQLIDGAKPKAEITARKWTTIAKEEVKRGLIKFSLLNDKEGEQSPE